MKRLRLLALLTAIILFIALCGCSPASDPRTEDIVILYTNDVHSAVDGEDCIGIAGVSAYKQEALLSTPYVTLVDCGDSVQGNYLSAASNGLAIIDIMNEAGYDYRILGNHEFDYKLSGIKDIIADSEAPYLNCNLVYTGKGEDVFADTQPYAIEDYGGTKIAFIGVTTPNTVSASSPAYFREDGVSVVDFCGGDKKGFYHCVQSAVDKCRRKGADYVVVLGHLGTSEAEGEYRSTELIANTTGIDVFFDAHSHAVIESETVRDAKGNDVLLTSTGTALANIGRLTVSPDGTLTSELISDYTGKDANVEAKIEKAREVYEGFLGETLFTLPETLPITDEDGVRMVRSREMGLGNFCADAVRNAVGADIGMINGGGVRATLEAGDVSTLDLIEVNPFGNTICSMKVTGAELLDMLECFYATVLPEYRQGDEAIGENGSFMQLSGMRVTIDTSIPTSIVTDDEETLLSVGDTRRVTEALVPEDGEWVPVDPEKTYVVAMTNYMAESGGCGMGQLLADNEFVIQPSITDYEALINYARDVCGYDFTPYYAPEGRITIR